MSGRHRAEPGGARKRRRPVRLAILGAAAAVTATAIGGRVLGAIGTTDHGVPDEAGLATVIPSMSATAQPETIRAPKRPDPTPTVSAAPLTRAKPVIPEQGGGTFAVAEGSTRIVGDGSLVTYTVEVEAGLPYDADKVARTVDAVLSDKRGWTGAMATSLQRVASSPTFRIRLASPETADALCAPLDTAGRLSCRNGQMVVLNAWRWANGADAYTGELKDYRIYMVNHEFGHALGNPHADCPGPGEQAPVMLQQTKGLAGCTRNPWPTTGVG